MDNTLRNIVSILVLFPMLFGLMSSNISAQMDERTIKLSGNYYWGVGFGEDRDAAISNAKRDLIERMIVRVQSESTLRERDDNQSYRIELETTTNTMSRMELRGLNYLPAEQKRNNSWESIAYISKLDFETSMNTLGDRLLHSLSIAMSDEKNGNFDAAIPQYMEILASSYFSPVPFYTDYSVHGFETELRTFLKNKINNWVYGLEIKQEGVRSLSTAQNNEFYFDLRFSYKNMKTSHLEISHNKPGFAAHPIRNGQVSIFYDLPPEERIQSFNFTLSPIIPENFDPEKAAILDPILPVRELALDVDFSEIIDIDFIVDRQSDYEFRFIPEIENLSVYHLKWEFENGVTSTETSPNHDFGSAFDQSIIKLTINNSSELVRKKALSSSGMLTDAPNKSTQPETKPIDSQETSSTPLNSVQTGFSVPDSLKTYIDSIIRMKDGESLSNYLGRLQNNQVLAFGRMNDVNEPRNSYLAVVNPRNRQVQELLSPVVDGYRFSLLSINSIPEHRLSEEFKGLGSIWFQFH